MTVQLTMTTMISINKFHQQENHHEQIENYQTQQQHRLSTMEMKISTVLVHNHERINQKNPIIKTILVCALHQVQHRRYRAHTIIEIFTMKLSMKPIKLNELRTYEMIVMRSCFVLNSSMKINHNGYHRKLPIENIRKLLFLSGKVMSNLVKIEQKKTNENSRNKLLMLLCFFLFCESILLLNFVACFILVFFFFFSCRKNEQKSQTYEITECLCFFF